MPVHWILCPGQETSCWLWHPGLPVCSHNTTHLTPTTEEAQETITSMPSTCLHSSQSRWLFMEKGQVRSPFSHSSPDNFLAMSHITHIFFFPVNRLHCSTFSECPPMPTTQYAQPLPSLLFLKWQHDPVPNQNHLISNYRGNTTTTSQRLGEQPTFSAAHFLTVIPLKVSMPCVSWKIKNSAKASKRRDK